jgi:hypothetical protein
MVGHDVEPNVIEKDEEESARKRLAGVSVKEFYYYESICLNRPEASLPVARHPFAGDLYQAQMEVLAPDTRLNDEVINCFLYSVGCLANNTDCYFFPTYFFLKVNIIKTYKQLSKNTKF